MRALSVLVVLPLLLTRLPVEDIAVWYLLMTMVGLQLLADTGFAPTFARVIAYAMGGRDDLKDLRQVQPTGIREPDWQTVERIWSTMHHVYAKIALVAVPAFAAVGTFALAKPIAGLEDRFSGWMSWAVVVATFAIVLRANPYSAYLQGVNQVALLRRWEALSGLLASLTTIAVLLSGGGLLALTLAHQGWMVASAIRDRGLANYVENRRAASFNPQGPDARVMDAVWTSALRSGIGVAMSRGVILSSGLVLAQIANAEMVASYLLASRLIQTLMDLSNAPFYSKLPMLARLRGEGREPDMERLAVRGMSLAYWTFVVGAIALHLAMPRVLPAIGSGVPWVPSTLWLLMVTAYFVERYGAMHLQLYSTTNDIQWHVANGVSGSLYLLVSFVVLPVLGVYAFPVGILVGYLSFYSWYGPWKVKTTLAFDFWRFQRATALWPAASLVLACSLDLLVRT